MTGRSGGFRAIMWIAGGTFGVQAMILVTGIISARLLGVEGRGQIALVAAVSALVARVTMAGSLPLAVSHLLAREGLTARDGLRPFVRHWAAWALVPSLVAAGYLYWILDDAGEPARLLLALATGGATYIGIVAGILSGAIQGELASPRRASIGALELQAPFFVLLVAFALLGWIDDAVVVAGLLVGGSVLGTLLVTRHLLPAHGAPPPLSGSEIRRVAGANYLNSVGTLSSIGLDRARSGSIATWWAPGSAPPRWASTPPRRPAPASPPSSARQSATCSCPGSPRRTTTRSPIGTCSGPGSRSPAA